MEWSHSLSMKSIFERSCHLHILQYWWKGSANVSPCVEHRKWNIPEWSRCTQESHQSSKPIPNLNLQVFTWNLRRFGLKGTLKLILIHLLPWTNLALDISRNAASTTSLATWGLVDPTCSSWWCKEARTCQNSIMQSFFWEPVGQSLFHTNSSETFSVPSYEKAHRHLKNKISVVSIRKGSCPWTTKVMVGEPCLKILKPSMAPSIGANYNAPLLNIQE